MYWVFALPPGIILVAAAVVVALLVLALKPALKWLREPLQIDEPDIPGIDQTSLYQQSNLFRR